MKTLFLCAIVAAATAAQASVPTGRFMQDNRGGGYRDIRISANGKSAVWITKDCAECKEVKDKPMPVKDLRNGFIAIGGYEFEVISGKALFHPSMGDFGSGSLMGLKVRR